MTREEAIRIINASRADIGDTDAAQWGFTDDALIAEAEAIEGHNAREMDAIQSGWQIGVTRDDLDYEAGEPPTEEEERAAMAAAGCEPQERIDTATWIAKIPAEWAKAAEAELRGEESECEEGKAIQECQPHKITTPDGKRWTIEIPMP